jgi:protoporphyrinogen oxidase
MKGLNLKTFLIEAFWSRRAKTGHLDGTFYYPRRGGIGLISEKLEEFCGDRTIHKKSEVSKIFHSQGRIQAIEINGNSSVRTDRLVSSLPLTVMLERLSPPPPTDVLNSARKLRYRSLVLTALFLNRTSINPNATVYFPDKDFLFTRIYEPRNRSASLSPAGKTSLVAELPCQFGDSVWAMEDDRLIDQTSALLMKIGWIQKKDILGRCVHRTPYAYPILEAGHEQRLDPIRAYLAGLSNLWISGRNAKFQYSHIHDQLRSGQEIVRSILTEENNRAF